MANNSYDRFLALETATQDLVGQLTELMGVINSYRQVSQNLAEASQGLFTATNQYRDVASQVGQVATSMSQVGMPQLWDAVHHGQQQAESGFRDLSARLQENQLALSNNLKQLLNLVDTLLVNLNEVRAQIERGEQAVAGSLAGILSAVTEATSRIVSLQAVTEDLFERSRRETARVRLLVILGTGLAIAAGVAATAAPFLNLA